MPASMNPDRWEKISEGTYRRRGVVATGGVDATGTAVTLAAELGVDLSTVSGTGKGGRITKADVEAAAA